MQKITPFLRFDASMRMKKIDVGALQRAYDGK
jgi:hypothetical protein